MRTHHQDAIEYWRQQFAESSSPPETIHPLTQTSFFRASDTLTTAEHNVKATLDASWIILFWVSICFNIFLSIFVILFSQRLRSKEYHELA
uniref:GOLD domain-containing protein n=1 Tax=Panagrellus redivivus TaxID=6233 RepID=A0A7E4URK2_PANRE